MQPLEGQLVVDFTRFLPGPVATRELQRLGARVVRVVRPAGDGIDALAGGWDDALVAGKETLVCDLKADPGPAQALLRDADVVVESFRPGVVERLGVGPEQAGPRTVYVSLTGFGLGGPHERRAGHDLNYLGWAGALAETGGGMPPLPFADFAGAYRTVATVLAALLERERTGRGARLVVSMAHEALELARARPQGILTGRLACYRTYATADGRHVTVGALEPHFFVRLCSVLGLDELAPRQFDPDAQEELADALAAAFSTRPLAEWLERFDAEDAAVGPVATPAEAARAPRPVRRLAVLVVLLGVAGSASGAAERRERIVFASGGDLFLIAPDGTRDRRITGRARRRRSPSCPRTARASRSSGPEGSSCGGSTARGRAR